MSATVGTPALAFSMLSALCLCFESSGTKFTLKRFFTSMSSFMDVFLLLGTEPLSAVLAVIEFLPSVDAFMNCQSLL